MSRDTACKLHHLSLYRPKIQTHFLNPENALEILKIANELAKPKLMMEIFVLRKPMKGHPKMPVSKKPTGTRKP